MGIPRYTACVDSKSEDTVRENACPNSESMCFRTLEIRYYSLNRIAGLVSRTNGNIARQAKKHLSLHTPYTQTYGVYVPLRITGTRPYSNRLRRLSISLSTTRWVLRSRLTCGLARISAILLGNGEASRVFRTLRLCYALKSPRMLQRIATTLLESSF